MRIWTDYWKRPDEQGEVDSDWVITLPPCKWLTNVTPAITVSTFLLRSGEQHASRVRENIRNWKIQVSWDNLTAEQAEALKYFLIVTKGKFYCLEMKAFSIGTTYLEVQLITQGKSISADKRRGTGFWKSGSEIAEVNDSANSMSLEFNVMKQEKGKY